jgi:hypothetical protein
MDRHGYLMILPTGEPKTRLYCGGRILREKKIIVTLPSEQPQFYYFK